MTLKRKLAHHFPLTQFGGPVLTMGPPVSIVHQNIFKSKQSEENFRIHLTCLRSRLEAFKI